MNIRRSEPTGYAPYALVFGQEPLHHFALIEEWKLHNITMEEDLPEGLIVDDNDCNDTIDSDDQTIENQEVYS
jgi:hypothetical protein